MAIDAEELAKETKRKKKKWYEMDSDEEIKPTERNICSLMKFFFVKTVFLIFMARK